MKKFLSAFLASSLLLLTAGPLAADDEAKHIAEAQKAAEAWLALADEEKYAKSWDEAAELFQQAVTREQWEKSLTAVRKPLGAMVARELNGADHTTTLPGAPDGNYVVLQFTTSFANKEEATETVTPMLDKDGKWKVSGYFIK